MLLRMAQNDKIAAMLPTLLFDKNAQWLQLKMILNDLMYNSDVPVQFHYRHRLLLIHLSS